MQPVTACFLIFLLFTRLFTIHFSLITKEREIFFFFCLGFLQNPVTWVLKELYNHACCWVPQKKHQTLWEMKVKPEFWFMSFLLNDFHFFIYDLYRWENDVNLHWKQKWKKIDNISLYLRGTWKFKFPWCSTC